MGRLIERVKKILSDRNFDYSTPDSYQGVITLFLRYEGLNYYTVFQEYEDVEVLAMTVVAPSPIPAESRPAVLQFLARVNMRLKVGYLGLDMEDGQLMFKLGFDLEQIELPENTVINMVKLGVDSIYRFYPGIMNICYGGKTDLEALKELDDNRVGAQKITQ